MPMSTTDTPTIFFSTRAVYQRQRLANAHATSSSVWQSRLVRLGRRSRCRATQRNCVSEVGNSQWRLPSRPPNVFRVDAYPGLVMAPLRVEAYNLHDGCSQSLESTEEPVRTLL